MTRKNPVRLWTNGKYWVAGWRDAAGALHRQNIGSRAEVTRREALAICADMSPKVKKSNARTLDEFRTKYLTQNAHLSETTIVRYKAALTWLERFFGKDAVLAKITPGQAIDFAAWLREQRRDNDPERDVLAPATVWGILTFLRSFMDSAETQGVTGRNPFESVKNPQPKMAEEKPYVTVEQVEKVIEACPNASWRLFFGLARFAGLRVMEALHLELGHVDWQARTIDVWPRDGIETTKQAKRTVPVSPRLYALLEEARDAMPAGGRVLCWEVPRGSYLKAAKAIQKKAGVTWPGKPFHGLRACLETDWMATIPEPAVCKWLGHNPKVARKHYVIHDRFVEQVTGAGGSSGGSSDKPSNSLMVSAGSSGVVAAPVAG